VAVEMKVLTNRRARVRQGGKIALYPIVEMEFALCFELHYAEVCPTRLWLALRRSTVQPGSRR
jgi:hypothetical protein